MQNKIALTSSKILFYFCLSFIFGIFSGSALKFPQVFLWAFLFFSILIIFLSLIFRKIFFTVAGFCFLFFILAVLRLDISQFNIQNNPLLKLNGKEKEIVFSGTVVAEPDIRDNSQKLKVRPDSVNGLVLVTAQRYPEYEYLDEIKVTGKLQTPPENEDFSYKNYLLKDRIYSVVNFAKVKKISKDHNYNIFTYLYGKILFFKSKVRESIRNNYSPPQSLILEGTILGDSGAMTQDLKNKLNITGLRHIVAVSGTHVVILCSILMPFLILLGFWRGQAFYISVAFVWIYIFLTGLPSSGIRAGIMGTLFLLGQKIGRQTNNSRIIVLAAAAMLLINPLLLFYDVGFQLSFLAVLGLIYIDPIIKYFYFYIAKRFNRNFSEEKQAGLLNMLSATFAAQIATLPVMVQNFGNISFIAPITNILVLPIVYWLMVFGFLSSVLGIVSYYLSFVFFVPCWFLLTYFIKILDIFSQPWAMTSIKNIHWIWILGYYIAGGFLIRYFYKFQRTKFLG